MSKRVLMKVERGNIVPADKFSQQMLREMKLSIGDIISVEIKKPRNVGFFRLAHAFGTLVSENVEKFTGSDCHSVLKALQLETGIECDITITDIPDFGRLESKKPRSLSFDSLDETRFRAFLSGCCAYVSKTYWPSMTEEQILEMAEIMVGD